MLILQTERLRLRELEQSDFDELYAMLSDPLVMRYYPRLRDKRGTQDWLDWALASYRDPGYALWAVELAQTGEFLGQCGLISQEVDGQREVEIGYLFKSQHWHKGYATEAARAVKQLAFERLGCAYVISLIRPVNGPSRAVAERNGMSVWKTTIFRELETLVYRVDADAKGAPDV
jgi:RimJ/RimL family protein N-acetyltransferase